MASPRPRARPRRKDSRHPPQPQARRGRFAATYEKADALAAQGQLVSAFECHERLIAAHPGNVELLREAGDFARRFGLFNEARRFYDRVLQQDPGDLDAANKAGICHTRLGHYQAAIDLYHLALERRPGSPELWSNLGTTLAERGDLEHARIFLEEALRLDPAHRVSIANMGELHARLGDDEAAERYFAASIEAMPEDPNLRFNLSQVLLRKGDLARGWREYENRLDPRVPSAAIYAHRLPLWDGRQLGPGELLICNEQGIGDQMMYASLIGDVMARAPAPILEIEPRLVAPLQRAFPEATVRPERREVAAGKGIHRYEWLAEEGLTPKMATHLGSLGKFFRPEPAAFPDPHAYLRPDAAEARRWAERLEALGPGLKVGLCWRSSNLAAPRRKDYGPLAEYGRLLSVPGVVWVNLQYDDCTAELAQIREELGVDVHDFPELDQKNDIDRTLAMIAGLDLVISAPTAVRVQSGALGVPTFVPTVGRHWTTFGFERRQPLFPAAEIVHADSYGDWAGVIDRLSAILAERAAATSAA